MKPYFVTLLLLGFIIVPLEGVNPVEYFAGIVFGTGPLLPWGWVQLWFLPHLFAVSVFSYLCCNNANLVSKSPLLKAIFLIIIISIGFLGRDYFWNISVPGTDTILPGLPFSIDLLLISSFYFLLGAFFKENILHLDFNWLFFVLAAIAFAFIHFQFNYTVNINMRRYDNIFISTITALSGIYLVISTAIILKDKPIISKLLSYVGSASLLILIFHNYIQMKTIILLKTLIGNQFVIIVPASFGMAVLVPILLYELFKRNRALGALFLPTKSNKGI
jgi:polysaccharide biosynthesis protein PslL